MLGFRRPWREVRRRDLNCNWPRAPNTSRCGTQQTGASEPHSRAPPSSSTISAGAYNGKHSTADAVYVLQQCPLCGQRCSRARTITRSNHRLRGKKHRRNRWRTIAHVHWHRASRARICVRRPRTQSLWTSPATPPERPPQSRSQESPVGLPQRLPRDNQRIRCGVAVHRRPSTR